MFSIWSSHFHLPPWIKDKVCRHVGNNRKNTRKATRKKKRKAQKLAKKAHR